MGQAGELENSELKTVAMEAQSDLRAAILPWGHPRKSVTQESKSMVQRLNHKCRNDVVQ